VRITTTTDAIRALLDADPDPTKGGPLADNTMTQLIDQYGSDAVGEALRPDPAADGRPANPTNRNR
jgi:hypothetical protein